MRLRLFLTGLVFASGALASPIGAQQMPPAAVRMPCHNATEIAKQLKIKPNYLYRVLGEMEKEGRVTKKGREYHPA